MPRIAFVVQRYGLEVVGGAETLCRQVIAHIQDRLDVEVVTTCAIDYTTWANHYAKGQTEVQGVTVHRFPTDRVRNPRFNQYYSQILANQEATIVDEIEWLKQQGPYSSALLQFLRRNRDHYDLFVFVGYLYFHTWFGLQVVADKSILIPTAHDEPPLYFDAYNTVFHLPKGLIFLSEEERDLVHRRFRNRRIPSEVIGSGITFREAENSQDSPSRGPTDEPYLLYAGRVDESKNCGEMFDFFLHYKEENPGPLKLVCAGKEGMPIPRDSDVISLGFLPDEALAAAMARAQVVLCPSRYESLGLLALEAGAVGTPILVNGDCAVLKGHCERSNGGLYYSNYPEFAGCLDLLLSNQDLRQKLGARACTYVKSRFGWDVVAERYVSFIERATKEP